MKLLKNKYLWIILSIIATVIVITTLMPKPIDMNLEKIGDGQIIWVHHKNNLYYHGAYGPIPSIEKWAGKSFTTNPIIGTEKPIIFEYNNLDKPLPNPKLFDTYNASVFCNNCSLDKEASKRKRKFKIYRCNGHSL